MRCLWIMFVTAVCFLFLLKLKWPKNKNIYDGTKKSCDFLLCKSMAFGELSTGHRERGGSKEAIQKVAHYLQHYLAADRVAWRHTIHQALAAAQFEVDRKNSLNDKRQRRKACAASTTTPDISFPCSH